MINISKTNAPMDLETEKIRIRRELGREVTANDYDNFRKDDLHEFLLKEQGGLCCYCMCRINSDNMQVEHFLPKGNPNYAARALDYDNLLATCKGGKKEGEKNNKSLYHCDTKKADSLLKVLPNPADESRDYAQIITYGADGKVKGGDNFLAKLSTEQREELTQDIEKRLNLNQHFLVQNRQTALQTVITEIRKLRGNNTTWRIPDAIMRKYAPDAEGEKKAYCGYIYHWLQKK